LRVPLESIVRLLAYFAQSRGASTISVAQVNVLVAELLVGQRALWQAFVDGLVTQDEVLNSRAESTPRSGGVDSMIASRRA